MVIETKISSDSGIIKIVTEMADHNRSKHYTPSGIEIDDPRSPKEFASTQTSSNSSIVQRRKIYSCYALGSRGMYQERQLPANCHVLLGHRRRNQTQQHLPVTTQKIISAKFLRVKQLQNQLAEANLKIVNLEEENRMLKTIGKRQDSALRKYEGDESHISRLLKSHEDEMRVISLKYKQLRNEYNNLEHRFKKQSIEFGNLKDQNKHLLQLSKDKHLPQREQLNQHLEQMKHTIQELKDKIQLQSRRLDLETKNHAHQLANEYLKIKSLQNQVHQKQQMIQKLQIMLQEKERCIATANMLTCRNRMKLKNVQNLTTISKNRKCLLKENTEYAKEPANTQHDNEGAEKSTDTDTHEENNGLRSADQSSTESIAIKQNDKRNDVITAEEITEVNQYETSFEQEDVVESVDEFETKSDNFAVYNEQPLVSWLEMHEKHPDERKIESNISQHEIMNENKFEDKADHEEEFEKEIQNEVAKIEGKGTRETDIQRELNVLKDVEENKFDTEQKSALLDALRKIDLQNKDLFKWQANECGKDDKPNKSHLSRTESNGTLISKNNYRARK